jgi:virginiamycin B lyase
MVTATLDDGRSVTVYSGEGGRFTLPGEAEGASTLVARLPGVGRASLDGASGEGLVVRLEEPDPVLPPGAAWVAELPAGETRRRFIVDCTGCHVTDASRTEVDGTVRDSAAWHAAVAQMVGSFGPGTGFPIISSWADPASVSGWLARGFAHAEPRPVQLRGPAEDAGAVLTEFPVPVAQDLPHDLRVDRSGTVLVTGMFTHQMYRLDPATGEFATTPIPEPGANPRALDIDDRGRWWVVLGGPGKVAVYDPAGDHWTVHDVGMYAHSIALGPRGRAWVNGHFTHDPEVVASVHVETGQVTRYTVPVTEGRTSPAESTIPYGLRVGPDGLVWGTQLRGNRLVRLDPESGEVREWPMPVSHAGPRRPDVAGDGSVWIPLYGANALARFDPGTETFRVWDFPVEGALPYVARVDGRDGRVWLGTGHGDVVASFDPATERFTLYPLPTRGALIRHLDVDEARGEVWFAYGASPGIPGRILRLRPGR